MNFFFNAGHFLVHFFLMLFPVAAPSLEKHFESGYDGVIEHAFYMYLSLSLGTLLFGYLGDKCDKRILFFIFFIGCGLSSIAIGISDSSLALNISLFCLGLFAAIYHPVGISLLVSSNNTHYAGKIISINGVFGNMGYAAVGYAFAMMANFFDWRFAFIIPGCFSLLMGLLYLRTSLKNEGNNKVDVDEENNTPTNFIKSPPIFYWRIFLSLFVGGVVGGIIFNTFTVILPKFYELKASNLIDGYSDVGILLAATYILGTLGQLMSGKIVDRYNIKTIYLCSTAVLIPTFFLLKDSTGYVAIILSSIVITVMFFELPLDDTIIAKYVSATWRSRAYSLHYFVALGVNIVIIPLISNLYSKTDSFDALLSLIFTLSFVGVFTLMLLPSLKSTETVASKNNVEPN